MACPSAATRSGSIIRAATWRPWPRVRSTACSARRTSARQTTTRRKRCRPCTSACSTDTLPGASTTADTRTDRTGSTSFRGRTDIFGRPRARCASRSLKSVRTDRQPVARATGRVRQLIAAVALLLLALSPLLLVIGRNISRLPLPEVVLARSGVFVIALVSTLIWLGQRLTGRRLAELPIWGVGLLSFLAITWTGLAAWPAVTMPRAPAEAYQVADAIIARTVNMPRRALPPPDRDIYLIVLDSLGRPDVLESRYGLDVSNVVAYLEERGFIVATRSRSAYPYTFQSL